MISKSDTTSVIHPDRRAFFIKHYALVGLVSLLLLPLGVWVLLEMRSLEWALGAWALAVVLVSICLIHTHLHVRNVLLYQSSEEVVFETGILEHHKRVVPLHMITDSSVYRSFLDKMLGVATLRINTSGGSAYEIIAEDFPIGQVERIHQEIHLRMRRLPGSMPSNPEKK